VLVLLSSLAAMLFTPIQKTLQPGRPGLGGGLCFIKIQFAMSGAWGGNPKPGTARQ
jgi:hypothetical protein